MGVGDWEPGSMWVERSSSSSSDEVMTLTGLSGRIKAVRESPEVSTKLDRYCRRGLVRLERREVSGGRRSEEALGLR